MVGEKQNAEKTPLSYLPSRLHLGSFRAIRKALVEQLNREFLTDPEKERLAIVPSNYAAEELYAEIASKSPTPVFNTRLLTLIDAARHLLAKQGVEVRTVDGTTRALSLAHVLDQHVVRHGPNCPLKVAARKSGTVSALLSLFESFEEACIGPDEAADLAQDESFLSKLPCREKMTDLLQLYREFSLFLEKNGFATRTNIVREAVERFESPGYDFRVKVYGFYDFTPIQWFFIEKLILSGLCDDVYVPLPLTGVEPGHHHVDDPNALTEKAPRCLTFGRDYLFRLLNIFAGNVFILEEEDETKEALARLSREETTGATDIPFSVVEAHGESGEIRAIARMLAAEGEKEGLKLVVFRRIPESVAEETERLFREFGLSAEILRNKPLIAQPPASTLLSLLKVPLEDFPRSSVIEILTSPFIDVERLTGEKPTSSGLWESVSRQAGITKGDDWGKKLGRYTEHLKSLSKTGQDDEDSDDPDRISRLADGAESLGRAFSGMKKRLAPIKELGSFRELADFSRSLLREVVRLSGFEAHISEQERASRRVAEILRRLESCDALGIPFPGPEKGVELMATIFREEPVPAHTPGALRRKRGIIIGDAVSLRGICSDAIYLASANEGEWPSPGRRDSLLREAEREAMRNHLEKRGIKKAFYTRQEEMESERFLFSTLFTSGGKVKAISYLAVDSSGKKKVPSPFLLELLSSYRGPLVFASGLSEETVGKKFVSIPRQVREHLKSPGIPSNRERVIARILGLPADDVPPAIPRRVHSIFRKASETLVRWSHGTDLFPDPSAVAGKYGPTEVNHTFLDNYIKCPYRTYLRYVVELAPLPEPEEVIAISRRELGIVAHRALQILFEESSTPSPASVPKAVRRAVEETSREISLGLVGLMEIASREIVEKISRLLEDETSPDGWQPRLFEIRFGGKYGPTVEIETADGTIKLSGKIDRVDFRGDEIRVVDYKYSKGSGYHGFEEKISKGLLNQVPIYAYAASKISGDKSKKISVYGGYIFLEAETPGKRYRFTEITPNTPPFERWKSSLELLLSGLKSGVYIPLPDDSFLLGGTKQNYCSHCDYGELCRVNPALRGAKGPREGLKKTFYSVKDEVPWHGENREAT